MHFEVTVSVYSDNEMGDSEGVDASVFTPDHRVTGTGASW